MNFPSTWIRNTLKASLFMVALLGFFVPQAQNPSRPKIGLTLSGGGAKGLAHIGILKAIDSAGIPIDYVTGTSMGAIIGSLYSVGYSGDSIEKIARKIPWDRMLSNGTSLRNIIMPEKGEYDKYMVELPWVNHWFRLSTGFLEGQELWIKFSELFFPVSSIKRFGDFPIPFRCISTDLSNGQAVVLDSGEITTAIRASMAIPSIFTAVDIEGKKLVDGGIIRNFPVKDVKDMGADFVIGSNVGSPLLPGDKVKTSLQVLLQMSFFREAEDRQQEVPLCNIYVPASLEKYTMASFGDADDIIDSGIAEGRRLYPRLKALADSLTTLYGPLPRTHPLLAKEFPAYIESFGVLGNKHTTRDFILQSTDLNTPAHYTSGQLSEMVRRMVGTRYYTSVNYSLQPAGDTTKKLLFTVQENPLTFGKIGLQYNQFSGISAILNLTSRDVLTPNSRSLVTVNLGQNFRIRAEHLQYFGRARNIEITLAPQFEQFNITTYHQGKDAALYVQQYFRGDGHVGFSTSRDFMIGVGTRYEWVQYHPTLTASADFKGTNHWLASYLFLRQNTLDRPVFPRHGIKWDAEGTLVYAQHPDVDILHSGTRFSDSTVGNNPYFRTWLSLEGYAPLGRRTTLIWGLNSGINFHYDQSAFNEFTIGGLTHTLHNQVEFSGLRENAYFTNSYAGVLVSLRYQLSNNLYFTGRSNLMWNNFNASARVLSSPDFLSGYSLTASYNFALGPLELSVMYSDQWKKFLGYINIGIPF